MEKNLSCLNSKGAIWILQGERTRYQDRKILHGLFEFTLYRHLAENRYIFLRGYLQKLKESFRMKKRLLESHGLSNSLIT